MASTGPVVAVVRQRWAQITGRTGVMDAHLFTYTFLAAAALALSLAADGAHASGQAASQPACRLRGGAVRLHHLQRRCGQCGAGRAARSAGAPHAGGARAQVRPGLRVCVRACVPAGVRPCTRVLTADMGRAAKADSLTPFWPP